MSELVQLLVLVAVQEAVFESEQVAVSEAVQEAVSEQVKEAVLLAVQEAVSDDVQLAVCEAVQDEVQEEVQLAVLVDVMLELLVFGPQLFSGLLPHEPGEPGEEQLPPVPEVLIMTPPLCPTFSARILLLVIGCFFFLKMFPAQECLLMTIASSVSLFSSTMSWSFMMV